MDLTTKDTKFTKDTMRPTKAPMSKPSCSSCPSWLKLQQLDLEVEREGAFAARAVEPGDLVFDRPGLAEPLPETVALLVEAVVAGVVAPEAGDIPGLVEAPAVFGIGFLVVVAGGVGGAAERPPCLVSQGARGAQFLLAGRVRI